MAKTKYSSPSYDAIINSFDNFTPTNTPKLFSDPYLSSEQISGYEKSDFDGKVKSLDPLQYGLSGLQEERAQNQSNVDKWGNALGKMGIIAATTFADGTLGILGGAVNVLGGGSFIDNPVSNYLSDLQAKSEEWMPNYYTLAEQNRAWYENLGTANFWADKVLKNFGFMIGTVASSMVASGGIRSLLGSKDVARRVGEGLVGKVLKNGEVVKDAESGMVALLEGKVAPSVLMKDFAKDAKFLRNVDFGSQMVGTFAGSVGEARIEALNARKETELELRKDKSLSEEEIQSRLDDVMNMTFATNMAVLSVGNYAQFGNALGGGYLAKKGFFNALEKEGLMGANLENRLIKGTLGKLESTLPTSTVGKAALNTWRGAKSLKNSLWEGMEEQLQEVTRVSAETYYGKGKDDKTKEAFSSYLDAFGSEMSKQFGDIDNMESFGVGFISALFGAPNIAKFTGKSDQPLFIGGLIGDMREYSERDKKAAEAIKAGNLAGSRIAELHGAPTIKTIGAEQIQTDALMADDIFEFKNAYRDKITTDVIAALNLGRFDEYVEKVSSLKNQDPAKIREQFLIKVDPKTNKELEKPIDLYSGYNDEELKRYMDKKVTSIIDVANKIKENKKNVDVKFANASNDVKNEVLWMLAAGDDYLTRKNNIQKDLTDKYKFKDGRDFEEIVSIQNKISKDTKSRTSNRQKLSKFARQIGENRKKLSKLQEEHSLLSDSYNELDMSVKKRIEAYDKSTDKIESTKISIDKDRAKLVETQDKLAKLNSRIDELTAKDTEERNKVIEELKPDEVSVEEFTGSARELTDRVDEFNKKLETYYGEQPQFAKDVEQGLVDLAKVEKARRILIQNLAAAYETNGAEKLQEKLNNIQKEYLDKQLKEEFKVFRHNREIYDTKDKTVKKVKVLGDKTFLYSKDDNGKYTVKGEEITPTLETINRLQTTIPVKPVATTTSKNEIITIRDNKAWINGEMVTYNDEEYLKVKLLTTDGKPYDKYYKLIDGRIHPYRSYSFIITDPEKLKNVKSKKQGIISVQVGESIQRVKDYWYIIDSTGIVEFDTTISNEEDESTNDEIQNDTIEGEEELDVEATEAELSSYEKALKEDKKNIPLLMLTKYDGKNKSTTTVPITSKEAYNEIIDAYKEQSKKSGIGTGDLLKDIRTKIYNTKTKNKISPQVLYKGEFLYVNNPTPADLGHTPIYIQLSGYSKKYGKYKVHLRTEDKIKEALKGETKVFKSKGKAYKKIKYNGKWYELKFIKYTDPHIITIHNVETDTKFTVNLDVAKDRFSNIKDNGDHYTATYTKVGDGGTIKVRINKPQRRYQFDNITGKINSFGVKISDFEQEINKVNNKPLEEDPITFVDDSKVVGPPLRVVDTALKGTAINVAHVSLVDGKSVVTFSNEQGTQQYEEQLRLQRFINLHDFSTGEFVGEVVSGAELYGSNWTTEAARLEGLGYKADESYYVVFKDKQGNYYYEVDGKSVPTKEAINSNMIFASVPTASLFVLGDKPTGKVFLERNEKGYYVGEINGQTVTREYPQFNENAKFLNAKSDLKEGWEDKIADVEDKHNNFLNEIYELQKQGKHKEVKFTGTNQGIPVRSDIRSFNTFLQENELAAKDVDIIVATKDNQSIEGFGDSVHVKKGFVYAIDKKHGNLIELRPRYATKEEQKLAINLLKLYCSQATVTNDGIQLHGAGVILEKDGSPSPKGIEKILQDIIGFGRLENISAAQQKEIAELKKEMQEYSDPEGSGIPVEVSQVRLQVVREKIDAIYAAGNTMSEKFGIYFSTGVKTGNDSSLPGRYITIYGTEYPLFKVDAKGKQTNEIHPEALAALEKALPTKFIQVSSQALINNDNEIYERPTTLEGNVLVRKEFKSYKDFLLNENAVETKQINYTGNNTKGIEVKDNNGTQVTGNIPPFINQYVKFEYSSEALESIKPEEPKPNIGTNEDLSGEYLLEKYKDTTIPFRIRVNRARIRAKENPIRLDQENLPFTEDEFIYLNKLAESINFKIEWPTAILNKFNTTKPINIESTTDSTTNLTDEFGASDYLNDDDTLRVQRNTFDGIEDINKAEQWFKDRFPNVPFEVVNKLINRKGWGAFIDGVVKIYQNAEIGTTYHEAFHVAFNMYLSESERKALIEETKKDSKFKQKIEETKKLYPNKSEDTIIEEVLAEEFRNWKLNNGKSVVSVTKKSFFKKLLDFIRGLITFNQLINPGVIDIFNRIEDGFYSEMKKQEFKGSKYRFEYAYNTDDMDIPPALKRYYKSSKYMQYIMDGITRGFMTYFFVTKAKEGKITLITRDFVDSKMVKEAYDEAKKQLQENYNRNALISTAQGSVASKLKFALDNWDKTVKLHALYIKQYKLEISQQEDVLDDNHNNKSDSQFNLDVLKHSAKESASSATRLLVATLVDKLPAKDKEGNKIKGKFTNNLNPLGIPRFVDFGKTFNMLSNKLVGSRSMEEIAMNLNALEQEVAFIQSLATRLNITDMPDSIKNFNLNLTGTSNEVMQAIQFAQTFAKSYINFGIISLGEDGSVSIVDTSYKQSRDWVQNTIWTPALELSMMHNPSYFEGKAYKVEEFRKLRLRSFPEYKDKLTKKVTFEDHVDFLEKIGFTFSNMEKITKSPKLKAHLMDVSDWIYGQIVESKTSTLPNFFDKSEDSDIGHRIKQLVELELSTNNEYMENSIRSFDGSRRFNNALYGFVSYAINEYNSVETIEQLHELMPFLKEDTYSKHSLTIEGLLDKTIKLDYSILLGGRERSTYSGKDYSEMGRTERLLTMFANHERGFYPFHRPADNSLERFIGFGRKFYSTTSIATQRYINPMYNYLMDEIERTIEYSKGSTIQNINSGTIYNGIMLDLLKEADGLVYDSIVTRIKAGSLTVEDAINGNEDIIKKAIENYWKQRIDSMVEYLTDNGLVKIKGDRVINNYLNTTNDAVQLKREIASWIINDFTARVEQTKLFSGDPIFYDTPLMFFKRMSGAVGTKKLCFTDSFVNSFIDNIADTYSDLVTALETTIDTSISNIEGNKTKYDSTGNNVILSFALLNEIETASLYFDDYLKQGSDKYRKMDEADGLGYQTMDSWRQMLVRSGDWTFGKNSLEELYQWELQEDMGIPNKDRIYIDPKTKEKWPIIGMNKQKSLEVVSMTKNANSTKPQSFGPTANRSNFVPKFQKLSLDILTPSKTKEFVSIDKFRKLLNKQGVGVAIYHSGVKTGAEYRDTTGKQFNSVFTNTGEFNELGLGNLTTVDTFYRYWGIQVDTGSEMRHTTPTGVQMVVQLTNMIYNAGEPRRRDDNSNTIDLDLVKLVKEFDKVNGERIVLGTRNLIKKLGLVPQPNGKYLIDEKEKERIITLLESESIKRDLSYDTIMAIRDAFENNIMIDVMVNREQIENMLFSISDKVAIRQPRNGSGKYQIASTMYDVKDIDGNVVPREFVIFDKVTKQVAVDENGEKLIGIKDATEYYNSQEKYTVRMTTNSDNFYKKDEKGGQTKRMVVYIANPFDDNANLEELAEEFKRMIGFRIPTQTPNSIESMDIKFLPKGSGDIIILPTEIVAKAGSDYDIDKLYCYLANYFSDKNNKPTYIKYDNIDAQYEEYYTVEQDKLINKIVSKVKKKENASKYLRTIINKHVAELEKSYDLYLDTLSDLLKEELSELDRLSQEGNSRQQYVYEIEADTLSDIIETLETLIDIDADYTKLKVMSKDEFTLKATENRFTELADLILMHPDNFENITTPISNDDFDAIKLELEKVFKTPKRTFLDIAKLEVVDEIYEQFMDGATSIGITAIMGKFQIHAQKYNLGIAPVIHPYEQSETSDGTSTQTHINLNHHSKDGIIELGHYMDKNNKMKIPMVLSQWINSAVDNAKVLILYIFNSGPITLNTSLYLTMAGVPLEEVAYFMNQPIIKRYVELKKRNSGLHAKATKTNITEKELCANLAMEYGAKYKEFTDWFTDKTATKKEVNLQEMLSNIGNKDAVNQLAYFKDFLRYQDSANLITTTIQKVSYDSKSIGKNSAELLSKLESTKSLSKEVINIDKLITGDGFMKPYYEAAKDILKMLQVFSPISEKAEKFIRKMSVKLEKSRLPDEQKNDILNKMKNDYLLKYVLMQPFTAKSGNSIITKPVVEWEEELLYPQKGRETVYEQTTRYKNIIEVGLGNRPGVFLKGNDIKIFNKLHNNRIIALLNKSSDDSVVMQNMKMPVEENKGIEAQVITEDWKELIESNIEEIADYGRKLAIFAIIQSGYNNSNINFRQYIPREFNLELLKNVYKDVSSMDLFDEIFLAEFHALNNDIYELVPYKADKKPAEYKKEKLIIYKYAELSTAKKEELAKRGIKTKSNFINLFVRNSDGQYTQIKEMNEYIDNFIALSSGSSTKPYGSKRLFKLIEAIFKAKGKKITEEEYKYCKTKV